ncbi:MAG: hypothetical protein CMJ48_12375 [Planctomycetaceae bacterium]|nr:hypothetical protein [Planctomycetaceae bacterium]
MTTIQGVGVRQNRTIVLGAEVRTQEDARSDHSGADLSTALRLREEGALSQAEADCRARIQRAPLHVEATHLLGTIFHRQGRLEEAATAVGRAIGNCDELARRSNARGKSLRQQGCTLKAAAEFESARKLTQQTAEFYRTLGDVLRARQEFREAGQCYARSLEIEPESAKSCYKTATLCRDLRLPVDAESYFERAIACDGTHAEAYIGLANIRMQGGRPADAINTLRRAVDLLPDHAALRFELGTVLMHVGEPEEAIEEFRCELALDPEDGNAWSNLGVIHQQAGRHDEAHECFRQAARFRPDLPQVQNNLGIVFRAAQQYDQAIECFQRALQLDPRNAAAHSNLAAIYKDLENLPAAEIHFREAHALDPRSARMASGLAISLTEQGRFDEAWPLHRLALELESSLPDVHQNHAMLLLAHGDFSRGWDEYCWRSPNERSVRQFREPEWDGADASTKRILVSAEQGVGDEIMFASCIPDLLQRIGHCVLECDPRLAPVFSRSFPKVEVVPSPVHVDQRTGCVVPPVDVQLPIGSLPRFLRRSEASFPKQHSFLVPEPQLQSKWRGRYAALGSGLKVGISWRGGKKLNNRRRKSSRLDDWGDVLSVPGIDFVNLQYGETAEEIAEAVNRFGPPIHDWDDVDSLVDLDDFVAQVSALDLVVSVSNVSIHTAGALGVPNWVVLPFVPDWRWLLEREDSVWYAGTRLFRQDEAGNWRSVLERLAEQLRRRIDRREGAV